MNSVTHIYVLRHAPVFEHEKPSVVVSLPSSARLWPTLHRQVTAYTEQVGGTLTNAILWAARHGGYSLLQKATGEAQSIVGICSVSGRSQQVFDEFCIARQFSKDAGALESLG